MVAKIAYGSSIYGAVSYNHDKIKEGTAKIIHTNRMIANISVEESISLSQTLRSFEDYLNINKRIETPVAHISINPSVEDKLSDQELALLTDDYMEIMGYKDQPYIVYKHQDIDREHIHIVTVRVKEDGKKISDSYDYKRSMNACRELEIKYGLKQISNENKEETISYLKKIDYEKGDIKRLISNTVKTLIKDYQFQTFGEFNALLSCYNIHSKQIKGDEQGNLYTGIIYSATKDNGEPVGSPIKSSRIGKSVGYDALSKQMNKITNQIKTGKIQPVYSKSDISRSMKPPVTKMEFITALKAKNIDVVFRENEQGRIYGVTFIDHNHKTVYNGSRLGKEFSANAFNQLFEGASPISHTQKSDKSQPEIEHSQMDTLSGRPASEDEIFGTFDLTTVGYDPQEEEFIRRMKRKKHRKHKF